MNGCAPALRKMALTLVIVSMSFYNLPIAHAEETDQDMPVGAVGGAVHADPFTGTATTSIPIEVPPGRQGIQPELALVYGSSNGNGWLGMGWKLEKGVIERQIKFGVDYSRDDYVFRLSGINVELVNIGNDEYRAKVEGGFTRVKKLTASDGNPYFEATDKTGKIFIFGAVPTTRLADPNDASKIFRWCLERVEDVHGNYMTLSYISDQGQAYLRQIDYTGHDTTAPTAQIIFHLENRSDAPRMYVPNFEMTTAKRLKTIEIKVNGNLIRAYKLTYVMSANHSMLDTVQHYGNDAVIDTSGTITTGTALPAVTMGYPSDANDGKFDTNMTDITSSGTYGPGWQWQMADVNGDGRADSVAGFIGQNSEWRTYVALSEGDGTFESPTVEITSNGTYGAGWQWQMADVNGDGRADSIGGIMDSSAWRTYVALSEGDGTFAPITTQIISTGNYSMGWTWQMADVNGDGRADSVAGYIGQNSVWYTYVALSDGDGTFTPITQQIISAGSYGAGWQWQMADVNGDGRADSVAGFIGQNSEWRTYVALAKADGTFESPTVDITSNGTYGPEWQWRMADVNGDGRADSIAGIMGSLEWRTYVALSEGDGTFAPITTQMIVNGDYSTNWEWQMADVNGDGRVDSVAGYLGQNAEWRTYVAVSQGDGTFAPITSEITSPANYGSGWTWQMADVNGDGRTDSVAGIIGQNSEWRTYVALAEGVAPTLTSLANGFGATTTIEFTPSTQYTNTQLPYPVQTVSKITTNDGNGNVAETAYAYEGGFHHIEERDFRGFNYVTVTGPTGPSGEQTITETWFHQGNDTGVDVNDPNVPDGYLKGASYRVKVTDGSGNLYTETTTTYTVDDNGQAPFFSPPTSVVTNICDGTSCSKQTHTDFTYDVYGNITREDQYGDTGTTSDDRTVVRTYDPNTTDWILSLPSTETVYQGLGTSVQLAQTTFYYDGTTSCSTPSTNQQPTKGQLTRVVKWLSVGTDPETRMAYDSHGNVICTRDANGHTTTMAYDTSGTFATTVTNPLGHVVSTTYYGVNGVAMDLGLYGQVKSVTDPNGAVVSTEYDALGRRTKVTQPDGFWTTTSFNSFGTVGNQHVRTDSQLGLSTWTYFDGLGRTITQKSTGTDSKIIVSKTEYDARGAVTRSSMPYFETGGTPLWSTNTYDPLGRVIRTDNPDGSRGLACFDDSVTVTIDANNHRKRTTRDAYGRVATVQEYMGTFTTCDTSEGTPYSTTTYNYDDLGNLLTLTDTLGNQSTMIYDTLSRKTSMHDPDMGNWLYKYDANGNLTTQTDAKGQQIHFRYDALNRRVQKDFDTQKTLGNGDVVYIYDGNTNNRKGRLQQVTDGSGTTTFFYDITGRVIKTDKVVDGTIYTTQSGYDGLGRVTQLTYPDSSTVTQTYNGPQLASVQEGSTIYASYGSFNALGQPSTLTLGNGVTTTYTYDSQNFRLKTLKTVKGSTTLQDLGYTFDTGGNVTNLTDATHGNQTFNYDDLDRLTSASGPYPPITYTYDQIGNMLSNSQVGTYTYPTSGSSSVQPHAVTGAGSNTYVYDANGNMTSGTGRTITYDHENRPSSITTSEGSSGGGGTPIKINFQPSSASVPPGYLKDDGAVYDSTRGYGWNSNVSSYTRDRNNDPDQALDTFVSRTNSSSLKTWTHDVDNGDYLVTVVSGDASYAQGHRIVVEGSVVINSMPTSIGNYVTITDYPVTVADGALTITIGGSTSGYQTNLNYVIITPVASGGGSGPSTTTTFLYDGDGGRVKKTVDDGSLITATTYIGKLYVCDGTAPPLSCAKMIFSGSQRIALKQVDTGSISYFHPDHLGSTSVLTDDNGVSEQDVAYYPYGATRSNTGTADVAYKYTGKEQDNSTGLYFYEARYYDPVLGRFISPDTIVPDPENPQALSRYSYVLNNPLQYIDPSGNNPILPTFDFSMFLNVGLNPTSRFDFGLLDFKQPLNFNTSSNIPFIQQSAESSTVGGFASRFDFGLTNSTDHFRISDIPTVRSTSSSTGLLDSIEASIRSFFSPKNVLEFAFGPEAVGKQRPSFLETSIETGTLFLGGPLVKGGTKLLSFAATNNVVKKGTTIIGNDQFGRVGPFAQKTGATTLRSRLTEKQFNALSIKQKFRVNDGLLRQRINRGDVFRDIGPDLRNRSFDLRLLELFRLKERGVSIERISPTQVFRILGRE